jgi:hypothetical protein
MAPNVPNMDPPADWATTKDYYWRNYDVVDHDHGQMISSNNNISSWNFVCSKIPPFHRWFCNLFHDNEHSRKYLKIKLLCYLAEYLK